MYTNYTKFSKKLKKSSDKRNSSNIKKIVKAERNLYKLKSSNGAYKKIKVEIPFAMRIVQRLSYALYEIAELPHSKKDIKNSSLRYIMMLGNMELAYEEIKNLFGITSAQFTKGKTTYASGVTTRKKKTLNNYNNPSTQTTAFNYLDDYMIYDISKLLDELYTYTVTGKANKDTVIKFLVFWNQIDRVACKNMHKISKVVSYPIARSLNTWLTLTQEELKDKGVDVEFDDEGGSEEGDDDDNTIDVSLLAGTGTLEDPYIVSLIDSANGTATYNGKNVNLEDNAYYKDAAGYVYYYLNNEFMVMVDGEGTFENPFIISKIIMYASDGSNPVNLVDNSYYKLGDSIYLYLGNGIMTDVTVPNLSGKGTTSDPFLVDSVKQAGLAQTNGYTITMDPGQYYKVKSSGDVYLMSEDGIIEKTFSAPPVSASSDPTGTELEDVYGRGTKANPFIVDMVSTFLQVITVKVGNTSKPISIDSAVSGCYFLIKNSLEMYKVVEKTDSEGTYYELMTAQEAETWEKENGVEPGIKVGDKTMVGNGTYDKPYVPDYIDIENFDIVFNGISLDIENEKFEGTFWKLNNTNILYWIKNKEIKEYDAKEITVELEGSGTQSDPYIVHKISEDGNYVTFKEYTIPLVNGAYYRTVLDPTLFRVVDNVLSIVVPGSGTMEDPYVISYIITMSNTIVYNKHVLANEEGKFYSDGSAVMYTVYEGNVMTISEAEEARAKEEMQEEEEEETSTGGVAILYPDEGTVIEGVEGVGTIDYPYIVDNISVFVQLVSVYVTKEDGTKELLIIDFAKYPESYFVSRDEPNRLYKIVTKENDEGTYYELMTKAEADEYEEESDEIVPSGDEDTKETDEDYPEPLIVKLDGSGTLEDPYIVDDISTWMQTMSKSGYQVLPEDGKYYRDAIGAIYTVFDGEIMSAFSASIEEETSGDISKLPDDTEENPDEYTGVLKGEGTSDNPYRVSEINTFSNDIIFEGESLEPIDGAYYMAPDEILYKYIYDSLKLADEVDEPDEDDIPEEGDEEDEDTI